MEGQVPGLCPAIPGYCAQGFINTNCKFDCLTGADICRRRLNRRPDAPLGDKIFLDLGQGRGVTDELLCGGEAMHLSYWSMRSRDLT